MAQRIDRRNHGSAPAAIIVWIAAVCSACGAPPPPFKPVADVKQLMQGAIDPNADIIWEATGTR